MKITTSYEESINHLHGAVNHATFVAAISKYWKPRPGHHNEVLASSWCWLFCWGMTGNGSGIHKNAAQELFNEIFPAITVQEIFPATNFPGARGKEEFHKEARRLRYSQGDDEEELLDLLKKHYGMIG